MEDGNPVRRQLTSHRGEAGVNVQRVPVSAQAVQGRLEATTGETGIVQIYETLIVSELFFFIVIHTNVGFN